MTSEVLKGTGLLGSLACIVSVGLSTVTGTGWREDKDGYLRRGKLPLYNQGTNTFTPSLWLTLESLISYLELGHWQQYGVLSAFKNQAPL